MEKKPLFKDIEITDPKTEQKRIITAAEQVDLLDRGIFLGEVRTGLSDQIKQDD